MFVSNVAAGAALAAQRAPDVVVFDGSGAAIPPIDVDRRVLVVGRGQSGDDYLNTYRRLISDVVIEDFELRLGCDRAARGPRRGLHRRRPRRRRTSTPTSSTSRRNLADRDALRARPRAQPTHIWSS